MFDPGFRFRRWLAGGLTLLLALSLLGCSSETTERKSFIKLLQTRILDKPGVHVPRLSPDEAKAVGRYASHLEVIKNFHEALGNEKALDLAPFRPLGQMQTMAELLSKRQELPKVRTALAKWNNAIESLLKKADASRAALQQPEDLKIVYDQAYARTVTEPAHLLNDIVGPGDALIATTDKVVSYIEKHRNRIKLNGDLIEARDAKTRSDLNDLLAELQARQAEMMKVQAKLKKSM